MPLTLPIVSYFDSLYYRKGKLFFLNDDKAKLYAYGFWKMPFLFIILECSRSLLTEEAAKG